MLPRRCLFQFVPGAVTLLCVYNLYLMRVMLRVCWQWMPRCLRLHLCMFLTIFMPCQRNLYDARTHTHTHICTCIYVTPHTEQLEFPVVAGSKIKDISVLTPAPAIRPPSAPRLSPPSPFPLTLYTSIPFHPHSSLSAVTHLPPPPPSPRDHVLVIVSMS